MILPYSVYVLFSDKDHFLYIGFSENPLKRLEAHNSGKNPSTKYRTPLRIIYCEQYLFKMDALNREKYFKTSMGKKALKLMLRNTFEELGYAGKKLELVYDNE
jgi:putative endonuclease